MKYQIIEREIYSEADLFHFGEKEIFGDIVNTQFPDYSGILLGETIFESEDLEIVTAKKKRLEIKRLKTLNGMVIAFFDNDELAGKFYTSENFLELKEVYNNEFDLELIRRNHNQMEVRNEEFYFPSEATDEQLVRIQKLLGLYFFEIRKEN